MNLSDYQMPIKKTEQTIINEPTESDYDDFLDEISEPIDLLGIDYSTSKVLKDVDSVRYDMGYSEYCDEQTTFTCPICSTDHDTEEDADLCCLWQCPVCSSYHEDAIDALYCCQDEPEDSDLQDELETALDLKENE